MSLRTSADVGFLLIDGYNVLPSGPVTDLTDEIAEMTERSDGLGFGWVNNRALGKKTAKLTQSGFFDDAAQGSNVALRDSVGLSRILCFNIEGNVIGRGFTAFYGVMQVGYKRLFSRDASHRADADYDGVGSVEEGVIVHPLQAETADGNTQATPVDNGAATTNGGAAYQQTVALNLDGGTSVTLKLRHSPDNVTYSDLATFANVTVAPAKERVAIVGTIQRYVASQRTFNGTPGVNKTITHLTGLVRA